MKLFRKRRGIGLLSAVLVNLYTSAIWADCEMGEHGKVVEIKVASC